MSHYEKLSYDKLVELILLTFDGKITEEQFALLQNEIIHYEEARDCYYKLLTIYTSLNDYSNSGIFLKGSEATEENGHHGLIRRGIEEMNPSFDMGLWSQLAEDELIAPALELPKAEEKTDIVYRHEQSTIKFSVNRSSVISLIVSVAAVIMIILFARYAPPKSGSEVATLVDSVNAKWMNSSLDNDTRFATGDMNWQLKSGVAELLFDNNTRVTIEGPAEFHIVMADQVVLNYGRLYANVPPEAIGFTVTTPNSKIIDLGTEFGIEAGFGGTTELHVVKGKTTLISGRNKTSIPVTQGVAKKISGIDGSVSDIECEQTKFARKINSASKRIWRGENIKLASIITGYDGFRENGSLIGLNPATGEFTTSIIQDNRASKKAYNPVPDSDFIDGVFVPDGEVGAFPISSEGHTFTCTNTAGLFTHEIAVYRGDIENRHSTIPAVVFNGYKYENESIVVLHSNIGITLDLRAIRASLSGLDLRCFKATGGITETLRDAEGDVPDLDFWVLLDGRVRYERKLLKIDDGLIDFNIELNVQDRFLTLIVGDGLRKEDGKRNYPYGNDFFCLIDPEICLIERLEK